MLLLFAGSQSPPLTRECGSPQLPSKQRAAVTSSSRLGISELTSSGQCQPLHHPSPGSSTYLPGAESPAGH